MSQELSVNYLEEASIYAHNTLAAIFILSFTMTFNFSNVITITASLKDYFTKRTIVKTAQSWNSLHS